MRASKRGCSVKVMGYAPWRKRSGPPNKREAAIESMLMHQGQRSKTHFSIRLKPLPPVSNPRTQHHNQYDTCFRHGRDFFNTHSPLHSETPRIALLVGESSASGNEPFAATWTYRWLPFLMPSSTRDAFTAHVPVSDHLIHRTSVCTSVSWGGRYRSSAGTLQAARSGL